MKKLRLEDLSVESFATAPSVAPVGTVHGREDDSSWCSYGSPNYTACDYTCEFACGPSDACTPACPAASRDSCGCTVSCPPHQSMGAYSGCDFSCEFAC